MMINHNQTTEEKLTETHTIIKRLEPIIVKHDEWINGNGKEGAKVRLDRLEQSNKRKNTIEMLLAVPIVGAAIEYFLRHWP